MSTPSFGPGIEITGQIRPEYAQVLTPAALAFVARLQRAFAGRRNDLLAARGARHSRWRCSGRASTSQAA